ncbi:transcriptional regulator [Halorubrum sp. Atlit-8R]|uniref:transcriptional regulator n=1 Tax=unclassified Halorubrum TaxID=2642239 RepID=UPI000EF2076A|nr:MULTISPECIES: transcriptional regulator [unclassified Halorubrum]RLM63210.1 transcriptional regulator [Halorubrum sp. Atlit-9R]RLM81976.1 transcriptional regulator [Halorubrum sp. Atlit-8R]TKX58118.1 transcriptional regulator [Halorubrum sp. SS7]
MPDLHPIAKRIHNVQPRPVRLELDSGETGVYEFSSTEFFQREFRGEGTRTDADADAEFRLISSEDYERILLGRSGPDEEGWSMVGEVVEAEAAAAAEE